MRQPISLLIVVSIFLSQISHAELWNKVVAQYNDVVITLWEVQREIQVERILKGQQKDKAITKSEMKSFLKRKIVEELILLEAKGFKVGVLPQENQDALFENFKNKLGQSQFEKFQKRFQWQEDELKEVILRSVRVDRFVKDKILSAYVYVTDTEVSFYLKNKSGVSIKTAKEKLKKQKIQKNLRDWIQSIKRRNSIRILVE